MALYLALVRDDAPQRRHDLREVFNALRWIVRTGAPWRLLPTNFPPWEAIYQQMRCWLDAGAFEAMEQQTGEGQEMHPTVEDHRPLRQPNRRLPQQHAQVVRHRLIPLLADRP